jgi:hypothetical protein
MAHHPQPHKVIRFRNTNATKVLILCNKTITTLELDQYDVMGKYMYQKKETEKSILCYNRIIE